MSESRGVSLIFAIHAAHPLQGSDNPDQPQVLDLEYHSAYHI